MHKLSPNALTVLKNRYLLKSKDGTIVETPEELCRRVARAVAKAETLYGGKELQNLWEDRFFRLLSSLEFLPNSPTLMNAGVDKGQLSACFVLPVPNEEQAIHRTLKCALDIQKSGGGTGFNFSQVVASDAVMSGSEKVRKGPVYYIKLFNDEMERIHVAGKRRGANMAILDIDHPDIEEFISCKQTIRLPRFNLSVSISDAFMKALAEDRLWGLKDPVTGAVKQQLMARVLWNQIIGSAWKTGDPGMVFIDSIKSKNPTPALGKLNATNPCGEVPLLPFEACNLGSLNLPAFIKENNEKLEPDWQKLKSVIPLCIRFLDNVIDVNHYQFEEIKKLVKGNRKIGLGVMGWAQFLILLKIKYDSEEAVRLGGELMKFIKEESYKASARLAGEKGVFPNWKKSIYYPDRPLRNATLNSVAPTGTISIIANTSSSIEPYFALSYCRKNVLDGKSLLERNSLLQDYLLKSRVKEEKVNAILKRGYIEAEDELPPEIKQLFKTSLQISPGFHLKHQKAFQQYTDNAVSKTINLPHDASVEDVDRIFRMAWEEGLKGVTVFRYGALKDQVLYQGQGH